MPASADPEAVAAALRSRGCAWPAPIDCFASVGSTNDVLRERARAGAPEWSVVLAAAQTAGRGRGGRAWLSAPGNLFVSVLLRPARIEAPSLIPLAAGVAVFEAAAEWGIAALLKWPNDVMVERQGLRKLAGILAEASGSGRGIDAVVLGIGVNLALDPAELPDELRATATSVRAETGRAPGFEEAAAAVLHRVRVWYDALARGEASLVVEAWRSRAVPWWGRRLEAASGAERVVGIARGIDDSGALILECDDGRRRTILAGDVRELRPSEDRP